MVWRLTINNTERALPPVIDTDKIVKLPKRKQFESIGFDEGGDVALILDADGKVLARYDYRERVFSKEAYLNG